MSLRESSKTSDPESLFLESLPHIERVVGILGRRYGLSEADVDEFGSWARAKLIEGDYAVFAKFGGRSSLTTYLSVVLSNLFKDFRNSRWGRWRPSAVARRLGPLAVRLETLVYRDGHPAREAVEVLKGRGAVEAELKALVIRIPARVMAREVQLDAAVASAPAAERTDLELRTLEAEAEQARIGELVQTALSELPAEDQAIVRMRFWDDFGVAEIARALHLEQKPLYRRLEAIQATLAATLTRLGLARGQVAEMLTREGAAE